MGSRSSREVDKPGRYGRRHGDVYDRPATCSAGAGQPSSERTDTTTDDRVRRFGFRQQPVLNLLGNKDLFMSSVGVLAKTKR